MNKIFNNKQLLVIFLLSIFAAGMLYMLVWLLSQVRLCWSSEEWPETKGTITQVEYRRKSAGSGIHGTYVNLDIDVRFEWKSKMYHTGNQGCSFDIPYKKLHVGKEIPVFVNENNPDEALLSKCIAGWIGMALGICLLFSCVSLMIIFKQAFNLLKKK